MAKKKKAGTESAPKAAPKKGSKTPAYKRVISEESLQIAHGGSDPYSDARSDVQATLAQAMLAKNKTLQLKTMEESMWTNGGLPLPSLAFRYLLCQDAWPLGRSLTLTGEFGSNKSTLAVEFANWLIQFYGVAYMFDAENKFNPDIVYSQVPLDLVKAFELVKVHNQQNWQGGVTTLFENVKKIEYPFPVCAVVDSISALKPAEDILKANTERGGAGARSHPSVPLLNADWLQMIAPTLSAGPFLLVMIQHSRPEEVAGLPGVTRNVGKGGRSVGYNKSLAFDLKAQKMKGRSHGRGGAYITITVSKNALGPGGRSITVPLRWHREPIVGCEADPETGLTPTRQKFVWGWYEATIALLISMRGWEGMKTAAKEINKHVDITKVAKKQLVWSRALGIPEEAPVTYNEAGMRLETQCRDKLPLIYEILGIERRPILKLGQRIQDVWAGKVHALPIPDAHPYRLNCATQVVQEDEIEEEEAT